MSLFETYQEFSVGDGPENHVLFDKASENPNSSLEIKSCSQSDDSHDMECIAVHSIKTEIEDDYDTTDTLQMFCESVMSASDYSIEPVPRTKFNGSKAPVKQKSQTVSGGKQQNRSVNYAPVQHRNSAASSFGLNHPEGNLNVDTSKTNVTAIMLQSIAPVNGGKTGEKNISVGATFATSLLARHHTQSKAPGPPSTTTVLRRSKISNKQPESEVCYSVCEDNAELKQLLVESNYNKHRLVMQLTTEKKHSEELVRKVEMLETVVAELKQNLQSVDPDGYARLTAGNLKSFYSELGL